MTSASAELGKLLEEDPGARDVRARSAFDEAGQVAGRRVVIYGAGNLGRRVLRAAREGGLDVIAFADANATRWGEAVDDCPIFEPREAARRFSLEALFVVAVWHPATSGGMRDIIGYLKSMGCRAVPFVLLYWREAERCLPYYLWDLPGKLLLHAEEVVDAFRLFEGEPDSQAEFVRQVRLRLHADFEALTAPAAGPQYFPSDMFGPDPGECFVDCGAYDGDSISDFVAWAGGSFRRVVAFEADPGNFEKLRGFLARNFKTGQSRALPYAVGQRREKLRFAASGAANAALASDGEVEVECVTLDEALEDEQVTFIKMDIEGSEEAALVGAERVISRDQPLLALCVYHRIDHLWKVPLIARGLLGNSRFALRSYCLDGLDTVCYAVPDRRWRAALVSA
jgi:FkbM family methyltransferase